MSGGWFRAVAEAAVASLQEAATAALDPNTVSTNTSVPLAIENGDATGNTGTRAGGSGSQKDKASDGGNGANRARTERNDPGPRDAGGRGDQKQTPSNEDAEGRGEPKRKRSDEDPGGRGQQQRNRHTDNPSGGRSRDAPPGSKQFRTKQDEVDNIMKSKRELMKKLTELMNMALNSFDYLAWKEIQGKLSKKKELKKEDWRKMFDSISRIILGVPKRRLPIVDNMGDDKEVPMGYTWCVNENKRIVFKEYVKNTHQSISDISVVPIRHMTGLWPLYTPSLVTEEMFCQVLDPNESDRNPMQSKVRQCALGDWFLEWYEKNIYKHNGRKNSRYDEWLEQTFPEERSFKVRSREAYGRWYQLVQEFFTDVVVPVSKVWTTVPPSLERDADRVDDQCGPLIEGISDDSIQVDMDTKWLCSAFAAAMKMDCSRMSALEMQQELLQQQLPPHSSKMDMNATALYTCCAVRETRGHTATDAAVLTRIGLKNP